LIMPGRFRTSATARGQAASASSHASSHKAAGDAILTIAERIILQVSQFAIFLLAARILGPAEFGLFSLVSACAILLLSVAEVAWVPFIMSRDGDESVPLQVLFVAILNGVVFGVLGALLSLGAGMLGLGQDLVMLGVLFALWVALANASRAQRGVLMWMNRLKAGALCEIGGELAGLVVAIYALQQGQGVFALVYGRLSAQSVTLVLGLLAMRRLPRPGLPREVLRELWRFSIQFFASRMLVQLRFQFITLTIGAFLGPAAVGFYRAAERLVGAVCELIMVPAQMLAWAHLRQARDQGDPAHQAARVREQARRHLKVVMALGAPLLLWLVLMNRALIEGLLGPEWTPAAVLVAILAAGRLIMMPGILTEPLMTILGRVSDLPRFMASILAVSVLLTLATAPFGVIAIAWGQSAICAMVMVATFWLFDRRAGVPWRGLVGPLATLIVPMILGVLALLLLDRLFAGTGLPALVRAMAVGLTGGAGYLLALAVFDQSIFQQVTIILRRRRPGVEVSP